MFPCCNEVSMWWHYIILDIWGGGSSTQATLRELHGSFVVYNFEEFTAERVYVNFFNYFYLNSWHASYKIHKFV